MSQKNRCEIKSWNPIALQYIADEICYICRKNITSKCVECYTNSSNNKEKCKDYLTVCGCVFHNHCVINYKNVYGNNCPLHKYIKLH